MSKFCTNCGTKLENDVKFCTSCGKAVEGEEVSNNNQPVNNTTTVVVNNGQQNPKNGLAIAGFVVSLVSTLLCCGSFNLISLILSIVGLTKVKDYNGDGKGLAIAGIVISAVGFLLIFGISFFIGFFSELANTIESV